MNHALELCFTVYYGKEVELHCRLVVGLQIQINLAEGSRLSFSASETQLLALRGASVESGHEGLDDLLLCSSTLEGEQSSSVEGVRWRSRELQRCQFFLTYRDYRIPPKKLFKTSERMRRGLSKQRQKKKSTSSNYWLLLV